MFGDQCVEDGSAMFKNVLHLIRKSFFFSKKFQKSLHFPLRHHLAKKRGTFENVKVSLKAFTKYSKVVYAVTFIS